MVESWDSALNSRVVAASHSKIVLVALLLTSACSKEEDKSDTVIAVEAQIVDLNLRSNQPDTYNFQEESVWIGHAADGSESRLLLAIPNILNLYQPDVVLSSIANIEVNITASAVAVNPEHIRLSFVGANFTPYSSWNSRFTLAKGYEWTTPGGDVLDLTPATASISKGAGTDKVLGFNITSQLIASVAAGTRITGFLLQIEASTDNASQQLPLYTSNSSSASAPKAVLTYSNEEVVAP